MREDVGPRAKIRRDLNDIVRPSLFDGRARLAIGSDIGAAELINCLFGVAHHEQGARSGFAVLPTAGGIVRGDAEKDFGLNGIGVLELVDENVPVTCAERAADGIMVAHQRARPFQEIVEIQHGGGSLELGIVGQHLVQFCGEDRHESGGDPTENDAVALIYPGKEPSGFLVEVGSPVLAGNLLPGSFSARHQKIEAVAAHTGEFRRMRELPKPRKIRCWVESIKVEAGQGFELAHNIDGFCICRHSRDPPAEVRDGIGEIKVRAAGQIGRYRSGRAVSPAKSCQSL